MAMYCRELAVDNTFYGAGTEQIVSAVCCLGSEEKIKMASLSNKEVVVEGMNYCDASAQLVVQERRLIEITLRN